MAVVSMKTLLAFVTVLLLGLLPGHGATPSRLCVTARTVGTVQTVRALASYQTFRNVEAPPADDETVPEDDNDGVEDDDDDDQDDDAHFVRVDAHRFVLTTELAFQPNRIVEHPSTQETSHDELRARLVAAPRGPPSA